MLHPVGTLQISQRAVPLDLTLDKIGNQQPADAKRFARRRAGPPGSTKRGDAARIVRHRAVPDMNDADKLTAPAYEPQDGGVELAAAGNQTATSLVTKRIARYEQIIIDNNFKRRGRAASRF